MGRHVTRATPATLIHFHIITILLSVCRCRRKPLFVNHQGRIYTFWTFNLPWVKWMRGRRCGQQLSRKMTSLTNISYFIFSALFFISQRTLRGRIFCEQIKPKCTTWGNRTAAHFKCLEAFFIIFGYVVSPFPFPGDPPSAAGSEPIKALLKTSLRLSWEAAI